MRASVGLVAALLAASCGPAPEAKPSGSSAVSVALAPPEPSVREGPGFSEAVTGPTAGSLSGAQPGIGRNGASAPGRLPLPAQAIASTIRRIGYACPDIASSAPMAGTGAGRRYRITCSSGETFRATVERGHMRFRRLGRGRG
jgi:hypothetical protein